MALQLDSLKKAIEALERALNIAPPKMESFEEDLREVIRAGVIQNFEIAYEQCWKFMQRWIRENRTPEDADHPRTRKELFRMAARYGLLEDPIPWFSYSEARNLTAHTYDESKANAVHESALQFLVDAKYLFHQLEERND